VRFIAAAVAALGLTALAGGTAVVRMSDAAAVDGARVTLGDVAVIETTNAAERAKLAGVVVAYFAAGVDEVRVDSESVRQALSGAGVSAARVDICGAATATVSRVGAGLYGQTAKAIEQYLSGEAPKGHFAVSELAFEGTAPAGLRPAVAGARPKVFDGRVRFEIGDAGEPTKAVCVAWATISRKTPVVVTRRRIFGGSRLTADDVAVEYRGAGGAGAAVADAGDAVGRHILNTVEAGRVLTEELLEAESIVKRNDTVAVEYEAKGVKVTMKATVLEAAATGDVVRLRRAGERSEFLGRITGRGKAAVLSGGEGK